MSNMKFVAYKNETFTDKVPDGVYEVMLNPEKLEWGSSIEYNEETALGSAPSSKYSKTQRQSLKFELVIDCTGVVDKKRVNLPAEMKKLSKVIYDFNGDIHRPNYIKINWGGGLSFQCVLTNFDFSYTFFKPDGTPLRAKVSLAFAYFIDIKSLVKQEDKQSPDMTHLVTVVDGDDLPQISRRIYRSPKYYVQIAQYNRLNKFRHLQAGSKLTVPPLIPEGASNA